MPDYLISDGGDLPKFARVDGAGPSVKLVFVEQSAATGFPTPEAARAMADEACSAMLAAGERKAAKALETGSIVKDPIGGSFTHVKSGRYAYALEELCVPAWLLWLLRQKQSLPISSRPSAEDVYGVFETFYVRSSRGWLSRSMRRRDEGSLVWDESFGLAVPFSSREAAEAELGGAAGHVLKASSVFTAVSSVNHPGADDLSDGVRSACEARDIESSLEQSAQERLTAMRQARGEPEPEAAPAKKAARL